MIGLIVSSVISSSGVLSAITVSLMFNLHCSVQPKQRKMFVFFSCVYPMFVTFFCYCYF